MTRVIQSPKDTVDECIESIGVIARMVGGDTPPAVAASGHLQDAATCLARARAEILRIRK